MPAPYTRLGQYPIVLSTDLTSLTSDINVSRGTNVTAQDGAVGKTAGMIVVRATDIADPTTYSMVIACGSLPASVWRVLDGSATYTPV